MVDIRRSMVCCTPEWRFWSFTDLCGVVTFGKTATDSYGDPWELKYFMAADNVTLTVAGSYGPAWDENAISNYYIPRSTDVDMW